MKTQASTPLIVLAACVLLSLPLPASTLSWQASSGAWDVPTNWIGNITPTSADGATIANGGTAALGPGVSGVANSLIVGQNTPGAVTIDGGFLSVNSSYLGFGSNGTLTVNSGTWRTTGALVVAEIGSGQLDINGGLVSSGSAYFGNSPSSNPASATVTGGTWNTSGFLYFGYTSSGTLNISNGRVSANTVQLGTVTGVTGAITLSGSSGNRGTLATSHLIRGSGSAMLTLDGGVLQATGSFPDFLTSFHSDDVLIKSGGAFIDSNGFDVRITTALDGTGRLTKLGEGTLSLSGSNIYSGGNVIKSGTLAVVSGGAISYSGAEMIVGETDGDHGALHIDHSYTSNQDATLGKASGASGTTIVNSGTWENFGDIFIGLSGSGAVILDGGRVTNASTILGHDAGAQGTATISSGTWQAFVDTEIGRSGTGTLNLNGGSILNNDAYIGRNTTGRGVVTTTGGTWDLSLLYLGHEGTGTLNINGGLVSDVEGMIGSSVGGAGTATLTSGTWAHDARLIVGDVGTGTLNVSGGLVSSGTMVIGSGTSAHGTAAISGGLVVATDIVLGTDAGSVGTAVVSGGTLQASHNLNVGYDGSGTLSLTGAGVIAVSNDLILAENAGSRGVLNIGTGGGAGTLMAAYVTSGSGAGVVNFNHSGTVTTFTQFAGSLALNKLGQGTTVLSGSSNYTGPTDVRGGALLVNGMTTGTGAVTVRSSGTLGGRGSIAGTVAITDGGVLAPGSGPDMTLSVSALALSASSQVNFTLGYAQPPGLPGFDSNLVSVAGDLVLDGFFNLSTTIDFNMGGHYTLLTYGGTVTNRGVLFGLAPAGYELTVTADGGAVAVDIDYTGLQFWNGSQSTPDGMVHGGSGTWHNDLWDDPLTNWTNESGNMSAGWSRLTAVFSGSGGTVNVTGQELVYGMRFTADGYKLVGDGALGLAGLVGVSGTTFEVRVDPGVTAEIATWVTSTAMAPLTKTGNGTLIISGSMNNYLGGTVIEAGTLETRDIAALGPWPVTLKSGATLAATVPLTINTLTWDGGTIALAVNAGAEISITGTLAMSQPGHFLLNGATGNTSYDLLTYTTAGAVTDVFTANPLGILLPLITTVDNGDGTTTVRVMYVGLSGGSELSNGTFPYTPTTTDFLVNGTVRTSNAPNTVNSLIFANNSLLQVFNNLVVTSGLFTVNSGSATIGGTGNVITPGDFTKQGAGLLNLLTSLFVNGNANINGGTLSVNGVLTAENLFVQLGAYLKGSGIINGNVFNNGTVAPGNSPGTLTINGNFTQSSSGILQIEAASTSLFDRLIVSGNAQLAGQLQVLSFSGFKFQYGQQFDFLQAGSISGEFDSIVTSDPENFRARFLKSGGTGTILLAPTSYTLVAQNQNQRNVAKALDSYIFAGGDREEVSTALDFLTADQYPSAFEQIMPGFYESLGTITVEQAVSQNQFIAQRMSAVKLGARGFTAVGIQSTLAYDKDGKGVADAKDGKNILTPTEDNKWGVWVQGNGVFARAASVANVPNYHYESGGFMTGFDYKWSENLTTGVYIGYQGLYSKYNNGGLTTVNSALFGGYATYQVGGFYADAIIGGGYNGYTARRPIQFSSIDRVAHSSPNGGQFTTYVDMGYDWKVKNFTFGPILSGQYTYAGVAPFTETDANSLNLRVDQQNINSLRMNVGGRIAYQWNLSEKIAIIPEGRLFWQHEFLENPRNIGSALDGGSGPSFDYSTSAPDRDSVWAGAGISAQFGETWNANFYYNANFGRDDFVSHMISGGLGLKF